jgi:hypothetical protein
MATMQNTPYSSAAERNRQPILEQLKRCLPPSATVLEIGSGTGQHAVFFSQNLPGILWQPSDRRDNLEGLHNCFSAANNKRILPVLQLDVLFDPWPERIYDGAYSANTAHIMGWDAVVAMFTGLALHLSKGASFCLYGPFNINGCFTSDSNQRFDLQLRASDPQMGIRDMAAIEKLANQNQMNLQQKITMPANNFLLEFKKL